MPPPDGCGPWGVGKGPGDIHSFKYVRQNAPRQARENGGGWGRRDGAGPLPGTPARCSPGGRVRSWPWSPDERESGYAPALPLPLPGSRALRCRLCGRRRRISGPGRCGATVGGTSACGFSSSRPPPGPRPLPGRRDVQLERGLGPFRAPCIFAARPSQPLGQGRSEGAGGQRPPPTHLRARAATPGGQRHPEQPQPLLPLPPEAPLRKRDHWSEAATLRIWSLPPRHRLLPSPTAACHPAPTVERKCAFLDPMRPRKPPLGGVLA